MTMGEKFIGELKQSALYSIIAMASVAGVLVIPMSFLTLYYPAFKNKWGIILPIVLVLAFVTDFFRLVDTDNLRGATMTAFVSALIGSVIIGTLLVLIILLFFPGAQIKGNFALPQMIGGLAFSAIFLLTFVYKILKK